MWSKEERLSGEVMEGRRGAGQEVDAAEFCVEASWVSGRKGEGNWPGGRRAQ